MKKQRTCDAADQQAPRPVAYYLIAVAALAFVSMTLYEFAKGVLFPGISIWQSHAITVVFVTFFSVVLAYLVFLALRRTNDRLSAENQLRRQAEASLLVSGRRFEKAQQIAHMGSWDWNLVDNTEAWSEETFRIFGLDQQEVTPTFRLFLNIIHPYDRDRVHKAIRGVLKERGHYDIRYKIIRPDGSLRIVRSQGEAVFDEGDKPIRVTGTVHDITEQQKAEETRSRLASIVESSEDAIIGKTLDGTITSWNSGARMIYGYAADEVIGKPISVLATPNRIEEMEKVIAKLKCGGGLSHLETVNLRKDGSQIAVSLTISPIKDSLGTVIGASTIARDVTEKMRKEELLAKTLVEKERLLKEIHHRVKNNMQIISSLLSLQMMNCKDKGDTEILRESQSRIKSMALIHEKMYGTSDLSRIDLAEYTNSLVSSLFHTYAINESRVRLKLQTSEVFADIDTAIPYGLILNELVTNCLKYAFPGEREGEISIGLSAGETVKLVVSDNGVGFPPGLDVENTQTLGMQLVSSLTDQLRGSVTLERDGGAKVIITFPVPAAE